MAFDLAQADQGDEFIGTESTCAIGAVEDSGDEFSFIFVEREDLLFDGIFGDQSVDGHGAELAESVGSVGGLVFDGWVPPGVHVDDVIGGREVESGAPCFEGDEEQVTVSGLEGIDGFLPFGGWGSTVEVLVFDSDAVERFTQQAQVLDELAEDQRAVFAFA